MGVKISIVFFHNPKYPDPLKLAMFEDPTPAIQVQTLPLEGPMILREVSIFYGPNLPICGLACVKQESTQN